MCGGKYTSSSFFLNNSQNGILQSLILPKFYKLIGYAQCILWDYLLYPLPGYWLKPKQGIFRLSHFGLSPSNSDLEPNMMLTWILAWINLSCHSWNFQFLPNLVPSRGRIPAECHPDHEVSYWSSFNFSRNQNLTKQMSTRTYLPVPCTHFGKKSGLRVWKYADIS